MSNDLYRGFWRWHFYGGLIVLPFLAWLAVTGSLYLFKPEIERAVYGDWITIAAPRDTLPASQLIAGVEYQMDGDVTQVEVPASPSESWRMRVQVGDQARTAFVEPGTGVVLGSTKAGGIMKTIRDLHSLVITGTFGNALIEIAAGWAVVLVVTGVALWWPRTGKPAIALRGPPAKRRFWRDLHASTGFVAGGVILFLALTGMPWSVFWGSNMQRIVAENGLGRPKAPGLQPWEIGKHHGGSKHGDASAAQRESLPWALQEQAMPHANHSSDVGVDQAIRIAGGAGLGAPMTISLPVEHGRPYSFSRTAIRAEDAHAIYIEPSSGRILQDVSFDQFGRAAQIIEWGVATHQGQQYGESNRWIMLIGCVALLLLCLTAPILWWKRRHAGGLKPPPLPHNMKRATLAYVMVAMFGIFYPLTGATMLLVALLDHAFIHSRARKADSVAGLQLWRANLPTI